MVTCAIDHHVTDLECSNNKHSNKMKREIYIYLSLNKASTLASTVLCTVYGTDGRCCVRYLSRVGKDLIWNTKSPPCSVKSPAGELCPDVPQVCFNFPEMYTADFFKHSCVSISRPCRKLIKIYNNISGGSKIPDTVRGSISIK